MAQTRRGERFSPWFSASTEIADDEWIVPDDSRKGTYAIPGSENKSGVEAPKQEGVIAVIRREEHFLVIRRSHYVRAPRRFCFPGGGIEVGESQGDALCREMLEELNAVVTPVRSVWQSQTISGVVLHWWTAELVSERLRPNPAEVEAVYWMTLDQILSEHKLLDTNRQFLLAYRVGNVEL